MNRQVRKGSGRRRIRRVLTGMLLVMVLLVGGGLFAVTRGLEEGRHLVVEDVDLTELPDGAYTGEHQAGRWSNVVEVTVSDGKITGISLQEGFRQGDLMDTVFEQIIREQKVVVDGVSGATVSGKAYMKAVENALSGR